jgi:glycosyltransferase involved in cell wall biosynthesis/SAM-dependent methyltransferase
MRILQVIGSLAPRYGGPSISCPALCRALAERGHEVTVYTTDADGAGRMDVPLDRPALADGFSIRYFRAWAHPREFKVSPDLASALARSVGDFDVVQISSYYGHWVWAAARACRARGTPYLLHPHGSLDPFLLRHRPLRKRAYARLIGDACWRNAAGVLFNSAEEMRLATGSGRARGAAFSGPRGYVVPGGVGEEGFRAPEPAADQRMARKLEHLKNCPLVVYFGRIDFKKGLDLLARAFGAVARANRKARLVLAGPESLGYGAKVRAWLRDAGVLDRATFLGPLEGTERVALLRRARLLALLSYSENFGNVVAEAMAAGTAVVISDRVNIWPEIERAEAGIVVPCEAEAATRAIEALLENPAAARRMGAHGREWVEQNWTWPHVAEKTLDVYAEISGKRMASGRGDSHNHVFQSRDTATGGADAAAPPAPTHVTALGRAPVSVLIPTRNEESNLAKCLASVAWADEVVVVDSASNDRTAEIARAHGATVVPFVRQGDGPRKRNWALENCAWKNEWVLLLDADEEVSPELGREIARVVREDTTHEGFVIRFHYFFLGRKLRHGDPLWKLCLVRHARARFETVDVPEVTAYDVEVHEWVRVSGAVGRMREAILHRDFEDLHHHFDRHNTYSDWEALLRTRYRRRDVSGEVRPRLAGSQVERRRFFKRWFLAMPGRAWIYFFYSYVVRGGFLDGRAGFIYNALKSFYWFQVSVKEYEIRLAERARESAAPPITPSVAISRVANPAVADSTPSANRDAQVEFYREAVDPEEEITRPRCYPEPVRFLLDYKIRDAWRLAGDGRSAPSVTASAPSPTNAAAETVLVICCGSGMEAEMVARTGRRVVALDISPAAVARARERTARFDFSLDLVVGDAENLPFADSSFDFVFVHDGLHHLSDPYRGVREMLRVARRAAVIAEPADAALTHLSMRLGISGVYEDAGNFVYRLDPARLVRQFSEAGARSWRMRRSLIYYQPWTFPLYRFLEPRPLRAVFRAAFRAANLLVGRWGNSLRAVAWKEDPAVTHSARAEATQQ